MCLVDWEIVHLFADSLIWPILAFAFFICYKRQISKLINRITSDSTKIQIFGLVDADFGQFEQVEELRDSIEQNKGKAIISNHAIALIDTIITAQLEAIKLLSEDYSTVSYSKRKLLEKEIID